MKAMIKSPNADLITIDKNYHSGEPVFPGRRVPIYLLIAAFREKGIEGVEIFTKDFDLPEEQVQGVLRMYLQGDLKELIEYSDYID